MALIEVATDHAEIRRNLDRLGLPCEPASFAPPRDPDEAPSSARRRPAGRGPPSTDPPAAAAPSPPDDFRDPPWQDDCHLPPEGPEPGRRLGDDASQVPPNAEI